jgi:uncharacterized membrane protein (UPF0182 family)
MTEFLIIVYLIGFPVSVFITFQKFYRNAKKHCNDISSIELGFMLLCSVYVGAVWPIFVILLSVLYILGKIIKLFL